MQNSFGISAQSRQLNLWESPSSKKSGFLVLPPQIVKAPRNSGLLYWANRAWEFQWLKNKTNQPINQTNQKKKKHSRKKDSGLIDFFFPFLFLIMHSFHCLLSTLAQNKHRKIKQNLTHNASDLTTILLFIFSEA